MANIPGETATDRRLKFDALMARSAERQTYGGIAVFWVFRNEGDRWCARKEGGAIEASFSNRQDAASFARGTAQTWGAYKLFTGLADGRMICESGAQPVA
jgi:hypothetical protein